MAKAYFVLACVMVVTMVLLIVFRTILLSPEQVEEHEATTIPCVSWAEPSEANMMARCKEWTEPLPDAKYRITGWRDGKYFEIETNGPIKHIDMRWVDWAISTEHSRASED